MDKETISKKTYALLASTLQIKEEDIRLDSKLADLTADSIQLFEVVLAFERELGLEAKYEELIEIETVKDIIDYLERQLGE